MTYRVVPAAKARTKLGGFPSRALDALLRKLAEIVENPYDVIASTPVGADPRQRWTVYGDGDLGFVEFEVDDAARVIKLLDVTWAG